MMLGDHGPDLPPQKLRSIRYNGRSPATSQAEDPLDFVEAVELAGDDVCAVNGNSFDYLVPPIKDEVGGVMGTVRYGGGLEEPPCSEQRREPSGYIFPASHRNGRRWKGENENALGHEIEIPIPSTMSRMEENGGKDMSEDHIQKDMINPFGPTNYRWPEGIMQANGVKIMSLIETAVSIVIQIIGDGWMQRCKS